MVANAVAQRCTVDEAIFGISDDGGGAQRRNQPHAPYRLDSTFN